MFLELFHYRDVIFESFTYFKFFFIHHSLMTSIFEFFSSKVPHQQEFYHVKKWFVETLTHKVGWIVFFEFLNLDIIKKKWKIVFWINRCHIRILSHPVLKKKVTTGCEQPGSENNRCDTGWLDDIFWKEIFADQTMRNALILPVVL